MARPSILDERLVAELCDTIRTTGNIETAIAKAGIGRESYYRWLRMVKGGKGTKLQKRLVREVELATAEFKERLEMIVNAKAKDDPKWAAWMLERKFPMEYGRPEWQVQQRQRDEATAVPVTRVQWVDPDLGDEDQTPDTSSTGLTPRSGSSTG